MSEAANPTFQKPVNAFPKNLGKRGPHGLARGASRRRSEFEYRVADLSLATWGRNEIRLAEQEMPGLMAARARYGPEEPLRGFKIGGSLHMTVQTAVLIETLVELGADVRWASCNIFSTQDHAASAVVTGPNGDVGNLRGTPVFAWKGETLEEYWECTDRMLTWPDGSGPDLLVDDGGDATLLVHEGLKCERRGGPAPREETDSEEDRVVGRLLSRTLARQPGKWKRISAGLGGVSEETTTGVLRLHRMAERGELLFPAIDVNNSVTKSKFDNLYGCRHSLLDGLNRATDLMLAGKLAVVCGYGDVGKGCAQALKGQGARVLVTEIDPICALQAAMEGYRVVRLDDVVTEADLFITATGSCRVITASHLARMKDKAVVANIGHFDNEIDMAGLAGTPGVEKTEIKPGYHEWSFADGHSVLILAEGRLMNLGCATGHPSFVMSASFTNQVLAQIELARNASAYSEPRVYLLPKHLDEEVARLHLDKVGASLTELTEEQAEYLGVPREGPFKPGWYRY